MRIILAGLISLLLMTSYPLLAAGNSGTAAALSMDGMDPAAVIRKVGEPIIWSDLGWQSEGDLATGRLTESELMKLSWRLRDIGRYLGASWPVIVNFGPEGGWRITDIRVGNENWLTLTTGQALRLVSEELEVLHNQLQPEPLLDFLVKDDANGTYRPLRGVRLSTYCYVLFNQMNL